jgi:DNA-binding LytR/AlgR family response regulator
MAWLRDRQEGAVRASWTAAWRAFRADLQESLKPRPFILGALAGILLAYLGPFGSERASTAQRYVYWPGVILTGTLLGIFISSAVKALVDREARRPILTTVLTAVSLTPPGALFVLIATEAVFGAALHMTYLTLLGPVFLLSLAMTGLNQLGQKPADAHSQELAAQETAREDVSDPEPLKPLDISPEVRFLERLPPRLRGAEIHAVQAEDHYLRVHTTRGSDLILMRLADAIVELDGLDGAQTHRSWWVARAAVQDVRRSDGRATLVLPMGIEAPVSRNNLPALRDRGWF